MKAEITQRSYVVPVTVRQFTRIEARDDRQLLARETLGELLDKLPGVRDIEYNGHFGSHIFFRVDAEDDTPSLHAKIVATIRHHPPPCSLSMGELSSPASIPFYTQHNALSSTRNESGCDIIRR